MSLPDADTLAELVRLPALLSVPGDSWAGSAAAGSTRGLLMPLASGMIYLGGMALNDWADREVDAEERPERPIPSGRVAPLMALGIGTGLVVGGVAVAGAVGGRAGLAVAAPLAGCVWLYDVVAKDTALGPAAMASCRALDVLLGGVGGSIWRAAPAAAIVGLHTATVTRVSQHEVHGATEDVPRDAVKATLVAGVASVVLALRGRPDESRAAAKRRRTLTVAAATVYTGLVGGSYRTAVADAGDPAVIRKAVGTGVMGIIPLQSSLLTGSGAIVRAALTAAAIPVGRRLRRRRAVT